LFLIISIKYLNLRIIFLKKPIDLLFLVFLFNLLYHIILSVKRKKNHNNNIDINWNPSNTIQENKLIAKKKLTLTPISKSEYIDTEFIYKRFKL